MLISPIFRCKLPVLSSNVPFFFFGIIHLNTKNSNYLCRQNTVVYNFNISHFVNNIYQFICIRVLTITETNFFFFLQAGHSLSIDLMVFSSGYFQPQLFLQLWQVATAALLAVVASLARAQSSLPVLNSSVDIVIALVTIGMVIVSRGSALAGQRLCRAARPLCLLSPYTVSARVLLFSRSCHLP